MNKAENKIAVSIVVPVYKVEGYLEECIKSILSQTLSNIEVILIDDGSPDDCGEIIDRYAKKDSRVIALHQKNQGYSYTVDKGINKARGEYIGIIESDDWIEPDMYEKLYKKAKKYDADIAKGEFYLYNSTLPIDLQNKIYENPGEVKLANAPSGAFTIEEWPALLAFHSSIWSSIYRASFIKKISFSNTAGASYQDLPFMIEAMTSAKKIVVVKKPFVHWRNDPGQGNSTSVKGKKLLLMLENSVRSLEILKNSGKYKKLKEAFFAHIFWTNINFFRNINRSYKKEYYARMSNIFSELRNDPDYKYTYLRKEDIVCVNDLINDRGSTRLYLDFIIGGIRRKINDKYMKMR